MLLTKYDRRLTVLGVVVVLVVVAGVGDVMVGCDVVGAQLGPRPQ